MDKSVENAQFSALPARSLKTLCTAIALSAAALASVVFPFFESGFMLGYGIFLSVIAVALAACTWVVYAKGCAGCVSAIRVFVGIRQVLSAIYAFLLALLTVLAAIILLKVKADAVLSVLIVAALAILIAYRVLLFSYYKRIRVSLNPREEAPVKALSALALAACVASAIGAAAFIASYFLLSTSLEAALQSLDVKEAFSEMFPSGLLTDADKLNIEASALEMLFPHFALSAVYKLARTAVFGSVYSLTLGTKA